MRSIETVNNSPNTDFHNEVYSRKLSNGIVFCVLLLEYFFYSVLLPYKCTQYTLTSDVGRLRCARERKNL